MEKKINTFISDTIAYLLISFMPLINIDKGRTNFAKFFLPKSFRSIPARFQTVNLNYFFVQ